MFTHNPSASNRSTHILKKHLTNIFHFSLLLISIFSLFFKSSKNGLCYNFMKQNVATVSSSTLEESLQAETSEQSRKKMNIRRTSSIRSLVSLSESYRSLTERVQPRSLTNTPSLKDKKGNLNATGQMMKGLQYGDVLFRCTSFN